MLRGQKKTKLLPTVQLCSAKASIKAIRKGEQAWFRMLHVPDAVCPHGVDSTQGNGMVVHNQASDPALVSKWRALLTEYANVFQQPGEPVSRLVDPCIDLVDPNAVLPKPQLYRMSEDELKLVKDTIDD